MQQKADSLAALLPERLETIVDKTLDDQFANIENQIAKLPNVSRRDVFLITLPLENFLEDIYFPANQPAVIYPRLIFKTIFNELKRGRTKKEIAMLLMKMGQKKAFKKQMEKRRSTVKNG